MHRYAVILVLAVVATAAHRPTQLQPSFKIPIVQFQLKNGLRVVLSQDRSAPVVAVVVNYDVGSRDEARGRSGFAHLFEHMMFQGSANVRKGEYFSLIENNGGICNGSTHLDRTTYYDFLPSNRLELALWLEADRMRSLAITRANLDNQRNAVKEEKRLRIDNQAYWRSLIMLDSMLFHDWKLSHPTIGSMRDLDAASVSEVKRFFDTYYIPNNAVLAIAGDIAYPSAEAMVRKYFDSIPRRPPPPGIRLPEPPGVVQAMATASDPHAEVPAIAMAWKLPDRHNCDAPAITLLNALMTAGASSRLYRRLVKTEGIALEVQDFLEIRRGSGALTIFAVNKAGVETREVQRVIEEEISRLKNEIVPESELQKVKNQYRLSRFNGAGADSEYESLQTALGRALALADAALIDGDPNIVNTRLDSYLSVTPRRIQDAAQTHLTTANRSIIFINPRSQKPKTSPLSE